MFTTSYSKLSILFSLCLILGCASPRPENHAIVDLLDQDVGSLNESLAKRIMAEPYHGNQKIRAKVEGEINRRVWWWLRFYTVRERDVFQRNLDRGENYRPMVEQSLNEHKLPRELYYLALIESGYVNHATSSTSAVGIWQFMRPTALNYGLTLEAGVDERTHPVAATEAAARYLADLHKRFDSWYLAIAAFNAGPGRVKQAIREGKTRDFWALAEGGYLPQETMDYIPKFLAAATIGTHLDHFDFHVAKPTNAWPEMVPVSLKPGMDLKKVSHYSSLTTKELLRYNPRLTSLLAHRGRKGTQIWLPRKAAELLASKQATLVAENLPKKASNRSNL